MPVTRYSEADSQFKRITFAVSLFFILMGGRGAVSKTSNPFKKI